MDLYRLENLKSGKYYENRAVLVIKDMTPDCAGLYRCSYQNRSRWSPPSELLKLVITGNWTGGGALGGAGWGWMCGLRAMWCSVLGSKRVTMRMRVRVMSVSPGGWD